MRASSPEESDLPTYIQLLTLNSDGRRKILRESENILHIKEFSNFPGVTVLGMYGVLGPHDFVTIVEAPDNEAVASFSIDLGERAGVGIVTMPAIPIARLESKLWDEPRTDSADVSLPQERETSDSS